MNRIVGKPIYAKRPDVGPIRRDGIDRWQNILGRGWLSIQGNRRVQNTCKPDGCCNANGYYLLRFSKALAEKVLDQQRKGYSLSHATVGHVIYWKKEGEEDECKVIVPELYFKSSG